MKRYRTRVTVQRPVNERNGVGEELPTSWVTVAGLESVPATIVEDHLEIKDTRMTPVTSTHRIIMAGPRDIDTTWSVLNEGVRYDIIKTQPTVGRRSTVVRVQLVVV